MVPNELATILSSALQALRQPLLADLKQLRLGDVQHSDRVLALVGGAGNGRRADQHQLAQQALVLDDPDVLFDHRPARQTLGQRRQVGHAAHRLHLLVAGQLVGQRDDVHGPLRVHQLAHAHEDTAMRVERKIVRRRSFRRPRSGRHCPAGWRPESSFRRRCSRAVRYRK